MLNTSGLKFRRGYGMAKPLQAGFTSNCQKHVETRPVVASYDRLAMCRRAKIVQHNTFNTKQLQLSKHFQDRCVLSRASSASMPSSGQPDDSEEPLTVFGVKLGIQKSTASKVIPLAMMFFCILFNYTILRDTKDVLVVTAPKSGAEIIPFLKTYVNLPMAIGFTVLYTKLSNVLSPTQLFYSILVPFLAFFGSFAFFIYPLRDILHPHAFCDRAIEVIGERFMAPVAILRNWSYCLFYVMAELWGSVVVSVLFWGFAVSITSIDESKQWFPVLGMLGNVALIASGQAVTWLSNVRESLPAGVDGWGYSLRLMMALVVVFGALIGVLYGWMQKNVPQARTQTADVSKKKSKMGLKESFQFLLTDRYIRNLALLVICYGISINLVEVTWKSKLKLQFPDPNQYSMFMGNFSTATGIFTLSLMLCGQFIFRRFGWGFAALVTPTVLLATGCAFFGLILSSGTGSVTAQWLAGINPMLTPLLAACFVGAAQNVFSKGSKYALFDPCKEMAYIPLEAEKRQKGKGAIDVICNPLGKSGGALIQQFLIFSFGSLAVSTPYLAGILFVIVAAWIAAAKDLDYLFTSYEKESQKKMMKEQMKATLKLKQKGEESKISVVKKATPSEDGNTIDVTIVTLDEEDHQITSEKIE